MESHPEGVPEEEESVSPSLGLHYHIIFATKDRRPLIKPDIQPRLHEYLGGIVSTLDGKCRIAGGVEDHVHLLVSLKATHRLADFMRELKKGSSIWFKETTGTNVFQWQKGYAAITVIPSARTEVTDYIRNQPEHHRKKSFREEFLRILELAEIKYDSQ